MSVVFVFIKQKTAYEMRISDWSSDVCSSDLQLVAFLQTAQDRDRGLDIGFTHQHFLEAALECGVLFDVLAVLIQCRGADTMQQIGRASCRERVCQYV